VAHALDPDVAHLPDALSHFPNDVFGVRLVGLHGVPLLGQRDAHKVHALGHERLHTDAGEVRMG